MPISFILCVLTFFKDFKGASCRATETQTLLILGFQRVWDGRLSRLCHKSMSDRIPVQICVAELDDSHWKEKAMATSLGSHCKPLQRVSLVCAVFPTAHTKEGRATTRLLKRAPRRVFDTA